MGPKLISILAGVGLGLLAVVGLVTYQGITERTDFLQGRVEFFANRARAEASSAKAWREEFRRAARSEALRLEVQYQGEVQGWGQAYAVEHRLLLRCKQAGKVGAE